MKRQWTTLTLACTFLPLELAVACSLSLEAPSTLRWRGELGRGYNAFADVRHLEEMSFRVEHRGAACDYWVTLEAEGEGAAMRQGSSLLAYDALRSPSGESLLAQNGLDATEAELGGFFLHQNEQPRPGQADHTIYLVVPPHQVATGGYYGGQLTLRLFEKKKNGHAVLKDQQPVYMSAYVVPVIEAVIGHGGFGSGRKTGDLHLGTLRRGASAELPFAVRSNMRYEFVLSSVNQGHLRHAELDLRVPYRVSINGRVVDITGSGSGLLGGPTGQDGESYHLRVQVPRVPANLLAGHYRDTLKVTVTSVD